jgi:hypothetical protein
MDLKQQKLQDDLLINVKLIDDFQKKSPILSKKLVTTNLFLINQDEVFRQTINYMFINNLTEEIISLKK